MAKGNLFLGNARGSVGDVTFYTKNGEQITRVRRRSIKNPNTQRQLYQRAVMATVIKAYQAGSEIFDHSFEGVSTGAASQARFQKVNMNLIRQLIDDDVANSRGDNQSNAAVVARGSVWPVANRYRISTGSLIQNVFGYATSDPIVGAVMVTPRADITIADWLEQLGIIDDDIFTIVTFAITDSAGWSITDETRFQSPWLTRFGFVRLRVLSSAISSTQLAIESTYSDVFEITASERVTVGQLALEDPITIADVVDGAVAGSIGVIRSRENSGERSTCDMVTQEVVQWGIIGKYIPGAWDPLSDQLGQSPLILEGGPIGRL